MVSPVMPESLAAGRQDAQAHSRAEQRFRELSAGGNQVLAIVEEQENLAIANVVRQRFADGPVRALSNVEHRGHGLSHQARIGERRQVDDPDAVGKTIEHVRRQFQGQAGLATPAGAGKRQQASGRQRVAVAPRFPDRAR